MSSTTDKRNRRRGKKKSKLWNIVIYHRKCSDGTASAWCFKKRYPNIISIPLECGSKEIPEYMLKILEKAKNKNVVFVDITLSVDDTKKVKQMIDNGKIMIIDHHITAVPVMKIKEIDRSIYNVNKSAAQLAWDYCFPDKERPKFINYIADRDLWKWNMPDSKVYNNGLFKLFGTSFETYDMLYEYENQLYDTIVKVGSKDQKEKDEKIDILVKDIKPTKWKDYKVAVIELDRPDQYLRSEVGHKLCQLHDIQFAIICCYRDDYKEHWISLRSQGDFDTTTVSEPYGGGGHKNASGFTWTKELKKLFSDD